MAIIMSCNFSSMENTITTLKKGMNRRNENNSLTHLSNRVNFIVKVHKASKENFINKKLELINNVESNINFIPLGSSLPKNYKQLSQPLWKNVTPIKQHQREPGKNIKSEEKQIERQERLRILERTAKERYMCRREESQRNHKIIEEKKQQLILANRARKIKMIKSERSGRENISVYWSRRWREGETVREIEKVGNGAEELRVQEMKMRILDAEEKQLNKFQELLCHQEQLARTIKFKFNQVSNMG